MYALPPNATHMMQPTDVSVFKPLKSEWKNTVQDWAIKPENISSVLTISTFCPLLQIVLNKENLSITIKHGFRKCGLFPYSPGAVDYTKCTQNTIENIRKLSETLTDRSRENSLQKSQSFKKKGITKLLLKL